MNPFSSALWLPVWAYRGFIFGTVRREFQLKYANSLLGLAWNVVNPLAMILIYTVVFSQVMGSRLPGVSGSFAYSIYLCAGLLTWGLFAEITSRAQNLFIDHGNLLKKINFPRLCLPIALVASALVNFAIIFALFCLFLLATGNFPGWTCIALLPLLGLQVAFAIGLGVTLGVLNVFFRDVGQFFGIVLNFWFWFTPIVYPASILPDWAAQAALWLNPMAGLIKSYQNILLLNQWPHWADLTTAVVLTLVFCLLGLSLFVRHGGDMVDEL